MKAVTFAAPIPRYLATAAAGRLNDRLYVGPHSCTRLGESPSPALPGPDWVRIRTRMGGICGSDLGIVTLSASPSTSPFSSFPFTPGHENVGMVAEVGKAVKGWAVGQRVVANPLLSCVPRGITPLCAGCAAGHPSRCEHFTDGHIAAGMLIGTTEGLGGSWGEEFVAHESQLVSVPDAMTDEEAVLVEPLACSVHAVRANLPADGDKVLVIGSGAIGLMTVAALHALAPRADVTVVARHRFQADQATRMGAARTVSGRGDYFEEMAAISGARLLQPVIGKRIAVGGFDVVYVCVGGARGMEDALRFTRSGGTVVLLGNSTKMDGLDWSPVWLKELTIRGSLCYGHGGAQHGHSHAGASTHAFAEAAAMVADGRAPVGPLLTHTFRLDQLREALLTAMDKKGSGSVKVAFKY
ncbi:MAG TPA: alcohol dehydrogenase catalytic domain-containing protein [Longimicrobiaceae bacterium]|nr:alcohol dehydrogenase catalytic domain-containing protein [Longimicrobiaceae bacterium]